MRFPLITDPLQLEELTSNWKSEQFLAVDTEASSFHHYVVRLCLIQVTDSRGTWLIDPLAIEDLSSFNGVLQDEHVIKILHDADFDIRLFHREHGIRVAPLFDTRVAAQLIGEEHFSLQALLKKYLGVELDKKFQKADWLQRPLSQEMLDYAAMDTFHLIELRDILADRLAHMGRSSWAEEEFEGIPDIPFQDEGQKDPGWLRIKWAKSLKGQQLAVLREVFDWREKEAERRDRAPFMVLPNHALIDIAKTAPASEKKLVSLDGMSPRVVDRYGRSILAAITRAKELDRSDWPVLEKPKRYKRDEAYDERLKRLKSARDVEAARLGLAQGVLCPNSVLQRIARERISDIEQLHLIPEFRRWQVQEAGESLIAVVDP